MRMSKYRKKPIELEAVQYTGQNPEEIVSFVGSDNIIDLWPVKDEIGIRTLEGSLGATPGDWIIKGIQGEFYPCKPDIFEATYVKVEESPVHHHEEGVLVDG